MHRFIRIVINFSKRKMGLLVKAASFAFCLFLVHSSIYSSKVYDDNENSLRTNHSRESEHLIKQFHLRDDRRTYFKQIGDVLCFIEGTDGIATKLNGTHCTCKNDYRGTDCGVPLAVFQKLTKFTEEIVLTRRKVPRRTINALNFNHEIDLLEARLNDLSDVVDLFVVCESNFTAHADAKPLLLLEQMKTNLNIMRHNKKIMYISLNKLPSVGSNNGWFMDRYIRVYMGFKSIPNIKNIKDDDLIILNDADELPTRSVLLFLKLYDGYPVPVKLTMKWSIFGFFWVMKKKGLLNMIFGDEPDVTSMGSVVTFGMLNEVFKGNIFMTRFIQYRIEEVAELVQDFIDYKKKVDHPVGWWTVGTRKHPAGFHCSWCFQPQGIQVKLLAAHTADKPRWGDFPEKTELKYLSFLRKSGTWFDGTKPFMRSFKSKEGNDYCPKYMLENQERFKYLLDIPE